MKALKKDWISTTVPVDVVALIDEVAEQCPAIESRSDLLRIGVTLALDYAVRQGINDTDLELRVLRYLHENRSTNGVMK